MMRHCIVHYIGEINFCYKSAYFRQSSYLNQAAATLVIFHCYRCVTTANCLLQVKVDSVTGRDDSLMDSLDFCYTKYFLFWVKVKCPLIFSLRRDLLKKSLNV